MTLGTLLKQTEDSLSAVTETYAVEARLLLTTLLGFSKLDLVLERNTVIETSEVSRVLAAIKRREAHEPLQYILGEQGFMGLTFKVKPGVLIPRDDTESLVVYALKRLESTVKPHILDVGTGSGAIAISLLKGIADAKAVAVDISTLALTIAAENAQRLGVLERLTILESDLFEAVDGMQFDLIISNPPYIPISDRRTLQREVSCYEPETALFAGEDGLDFYRRMIPAAGRYLKSDGLLMFEAGHDQGERIAAMMREAGYEDVHLECDLRGVPRFIIGKCRHGGYDV
ncbi:peptide chain release factor N(5)-glutamine methyltransferase [Fusibacter paucivorans]|uniref:Release factor glutamine methyltransferase n=1 Tax=Fusibacter paucivorans TaxID=76009 RepID=A0ABS5PP52_9FIRM|nr:peptide chain release factor N(5)-glutamine methyltransferase [Fusibacter paucivorans]MBS7525827.1 peptide chain release factor N(5)-glutamine methyltransferase [Fusibacter paucivorans]